MVKKTGFWNGFYGRVGGFTTGGQQKTWLTVVKRFAKPALVFLIAGFAGLNSQLGYEWAGAVVGGILALDKFLQIQGWY